MPEKYKANIHPQNEQDIQAITDRMHQQSAEIDHELNQFFLGNKDKIFKWMWSTHLKSPHEEPSDPNKRKKLAFDGQIPSAALIRPESAEKVHRYVTRHIKGYFDEEEAKRPPQGPSYDLPPPKE